MPTPGSAPDTRITYDRDLKFSPAVMDVIHRAIAIIQEYADQGFDLTLRQLYYQFVARGWLPNRDTSYKRLGEIIGNARMGGLLPWSAIVDRTRFIRKLSHWDTPRDIIAGAAASYHNDLWRDQPKRVEVWIEKDALVGVFQGRCEDWDVPLFSCRGYTSVSEVWRAAQRLGSYLAAGQDVVILHFGDHDPSGIDMTRDIEDRLHTFLYGDWVRWAREDGLSRHFDMADTAQVERYLEQHGHLAWHRRFSIRRMALNYDQVEQYQPPPNPAKSSDSRFRRYLEEHGDESWELDALEPTVLADLVEAGIADEIDQDKFDAAQERQQRGVQLLEAASKRWTELETVLAAEPPANGRDTT